MSCICWCPAINYIAAFISNCKLCSNYFLFSSNVSFAYLNLLISHCNIDNNTIIWNMNMMLCSIYHISCRGCYFFYNPFAVRNITKGKCSILISFCCSNSVLFWKFCSTYFKDTNNCAFELIIIFVYLNTFNLTSFKCIIDFLITTNIYFNDLCVLSSIISVKLIMLIW